MKKIFVVAFLIFIINIIPAKAFYLSGESSVLMDMDSNIVLYGSNIHSRMKTASIAKVMTTIVAIENGFLSEYVKVTKESVNQIGSKIYLIEDDEILLIDLLYGLMLRSGNDAAYQIAEYVLGYDDFIIEMNEFAKRIGMKNSTFENPSGLDEETVNYSTAYDMALLMSYAMQNDVFKEITGTRVHGCTTKTGNRYVWSNKHRLVQTEGIFTGGKTGYTKSAGRTLITTATDGDLNLVVVTFRASSDWSDHRTLFDYGFSNFDSYPVIKAQSLKIRNNFYDYHPYILDDIVIPLRKGSKNDIDVQIHLKNSSNDFIIGKIIVYLNNEILIEENVYQRESDIIKETLVNSFKRIYL